MVGVAAAPVYPLRGKKPFAEKDFPPTEIYCDGDVAFRQHGGGHTDAPNWPTFLNFTERFFKATTTNQ
jgi:hypothetical protein